MDFQVSKHFLSQVDLGRRYCDLGRWAVLLERAAEVCGLGPPTVLEGFPISGGPTVVFLVGDLIIKFYTKDPPVRHNGSMLHVGVLQTRWSTPSKLS
jgi:hypothetical protein